MPRRPRVIFPNVAQHIIQHGNNRQACFYADYAQRCVDSGGTSNYYCSVAPFMCKWTPEVGNWTACVRQCLQTADNVICRTPNGCGADTSCTTVAHADCWFHCALDASRPSPNLPQ
jgi:hypothetical protein